MSGFELREATPGDLPFLREMLVEAAYWRPGTRPDDTEAALARPDLRYLLEGFGRPGDAGVVAGEAGCPLGAAWYRLWTNDRHSYGFVDESTPELAIGVRAEARGRGIGGALIARLLELAGRQGIGRVSLSVELDNPARRLYERSGFRTFAPDEGAVTMVAETRTGPRP